MCENINIVAFTVNFELTEHSIQLIKDPHKIFCGNSKGSQRITHQDFLSSRYYNLESKIVFLKSYILGTANYVPSVDYSKLTSRSNVPEEDPDVETFPKVISKNKLKDEAINIDDIVTELENHDGKIIKHFAKPIPQDEAAATTLAPTTGAVGGSSPAPTSAASSPKPSTTRRVSTTPRVSTTARVSTTPRVSTARRPSTTQRSSTTRPPTTMTSNFDFDTELFGKLRNQTLLKPFAAAQDPKLQLPNMQQEEQIKPKFSALQSHEPKPHHVPTVSIDQSHDAPLAINHPPLQYPQVAIPKEMPQLPQTVNNKTISVEDIYGKNSIQQENPKNNPDTDFFSRKPNIASIDTNFDVENFLKQIGQTTLSGTQVDNFKNGSLKSSEVDLNHSMANLNESNAEINMNKMVSYENSSQVKPTKNPYLPVDTSTESSQDHVFSESKPTFNPYLPSELQEKVPPSPFESNITTLHPEKPAIPLETIITTTTTTLAPSIITDATLSSESPTFNPYLPRESPLIQKEYSNPIRNNTKTAEDFFKSPFLPINSSLETNGETATTLFVTPVPYIAKVIDNSSTVPEGNIFHEKPSSTSPQVIYNPYLPKETTNSTETVAPTYASETPFTEKPSANPSPVTNNPYLPQENTTGMSEASLSNITPAVNTETPFSTETPTVNPYLPKESSVEPENVNNQSQNNSDSNADSAAASISAAMNFQYQSIEAQLQLQAEGNEDFENNTNATQPPPTILSKQQDILPSQNQQNLSMYEKNNPYLSPGILDYNTSKVESKQMELPVVPAYLITVSPNSSPTTTLPPAQNPWLPRDLNVSDSDSSYLSYNSSNVSNNKILSKQDEYQTPSVFTNYTATVAPQVETIEQTTHSPFPNKGTNATSNNENPFLLSENVNLPTGKQDEEKGGLYPLFPTFFMTTTVQPTYGASLGNGTNAASTNNNSPYLSEVNANISSDKQIEGKQEQMTVLPYCPENFQMTTPPPYPCIPYPVSSGVQSTSLSSTPFTTVAPETTQLYSTGSTTSDSTTATVYGTNLTQYAQSLSEYAKHLENYARNITQNDNSNNYSATAPVTTTTQTISTANPYINVESTQDLLKQEEVKQEGFGNGNANNYSANIVVTTTAPTVSIANPYINVESAQGLFKQEEAKQEGFGNGNANNYSANMVTTTPTTSTVNPYVNAESTHGLSKQEEVKQEEFGGPLLVPENPFLPEVNKPFTNGAVKRPQISNILINASHQKPVQTILTPVTALPSSVKELNNYNVTNTNLGKVPSLLSNVTQPQPYSSNILPEAYNLTSLTATNKNPVSYSRSPDDNISYTNQSPMFIQSTVPPVPYIITTTQPVNLQNTSLALMTLNETLPSLSGSSTGIPYSSAPYISYGSKEIPDESYKLPPEVPQKPKPMNYSYLYPLDITESPMPEPKIHSTTTQKPQSEAGMYGLQKEQKLQFGVAEKDIPLDSKEAQDILSGRLSVVKVKFPVTSTADYEALKEQNLYLGGAQNKDTNGSAENTLIGYYNQTNKEQMNQPSDVVAPKNESITSNEGLKSGGSKYGAIIDNSQAFAGSYVDNSLVSSKMKELTPINAKVEKETPSALVVNPPVTGSRKPTIETPVNNVETTYEKPAIPKEPYYRKPEFHGISEIPSMLSETGQNETKITITANPPVYTTTLQNINTTTAPATFTTSTSTPLLEHLTRNYSEPSILNAVGDQDSNPKSHPINSNLTFQADYYPQYLNYQNNSYSNTLYTTSLPYIYNNATITQNEEKKMPGSANMSVAELQQVFADADRNAASQLQLVAHKTNVTPAYEQPVHPLGETMPPAWTTTVKRMF